MYHVRIDNIFGPILLVLALASASTAHVVLRLVVACPCIYTMGRFTILRAPACL